MNRQTQFGDVSDSILRAGLVAAARGETIRAVITLSYAALAAAESGYRPAPPLQAKVAATLAALQANLPDPAFQEAVERGRQMSIEELFHSF